MDRLRNSLNRLLHLRIRIIIQRIPIKSPSFLAVQRILGDTVRARGKLIYITFEISYNGGEPQINEIQGPGIVQEKEKEQGKKRKT